MDISLIERLEYKVSYALTLAEQYERIGYSDYARTALACAQQWEACLERAYDNAK